MILSIQAHLDDRELNSYGLLMSLKKTLNTKIHSLVLCNGREFSDGIEREKIHKHCSFVFGASDKLFHYKDLTLADQNLSEISDILYNEIRTLKPQCILFPSESDLHQDHRFLSQASKIAIQRFVRDFHVRKLTCIEVHSPNMFSDLNSFKRYFLREDEYTDKCELLQLYKTEKLQPYSCEYFKVYNVHSQNNSNTFNFCNIGSILDE
jgi:LmbE family N-acetylglucosaminyl deacetylase